MITLNTKLEKLPRISAAHSKKLEKLGLFTVQDLLYHFPFRYEDYSQIFSIAELSSDMHATVIAHVSDVKTVRIYKRRITITTATLTDESGSITAIWFNQPFVENTLSTEKELRFSGKIQFDKKNKLHFSAPNVERVERVPTSTGRLVPTYPETAGITSKWLRWQIQLLFEKGISFKDPLPKKILDELHLPHLERAIKLIHFPRDGKDFTYAQKRFIFEDMFLLQLVTLRARAALNSEKSISIPLDKKLIKKLISSLPFTPTDAQKKSSFQILTDMEKTTPMNRLLNGDVGAGKTLVAAIAALQCVSAGHQVAILAPTEVLARQHYESILSLMEQFGFSIGLLTGAYKIHGTHPALSQNTTRPKIIEMIKSKEIDIVIGTHAIIQEDVEFSDLGLIVVDEQHRFGVAQRANLTRKSIESSDGNKNTVPHFLTMTATPIPRTFALALFGDLSVSVLDEKPKNRKEIKTTLFHPKKRDALYEKIKKEIKKGHQVYIILPLVEESETLQDVKSAKKEFNDLSSGVFSEYSLGLMHGRLKSKEKER